MADTPSIDPNVLRQIENTVNDMRSTDYPCFERHIRKLAHLLHTPGLSEITDELTKDIDLDAWLKAGEATIGSFVGSGRLEWPADPKQELGTVIKLIDRSAENPNWAIQYFAFNFLYAGSELAANAQNLAEQVFVPFARDYIEYVSQIAMPARQDAAPAKRSPASRKVFVVHGHDEAAREAVARFLDKLDLEPVILHERPNKGRTLITKFREESTDIGFAVVLMTPDDQGAEAGVPAARPRARQNVVFELGFFIGAYGPEHVAALVKGNIEHPSDFHGVVYIDLDDAGGWKRQLGRELQAAGFEIDWNKVMRS